MRSLSFVLLAACGSSEEVAPTGTTTLVEAPSAYEYEDDRQTAIPDLDEMSLGLDEFVDAALKLSAQPVFEAYQSSLEGADTTCPDWYEQDGNVFWYSQCTSDDGTRFDGYGFTYIYDQEDVFGDGNLWDAEVISGAATITRADGGMFHYGGQASLAQGLNEEYSADLYYSAVAGSFLWESADATSSWITSGASPVFTIYGLDYPHYGRYLYLSGSASGLGAVASAVDTDALVIGDTTTGFPCDLEPAGTVAVRSSDGLWVEVVFDVDPDDYSMTGDCDGCGTATFEGDVLGQVCADFTPLLDWEGSTPW